MLLRILFLFFNFTSYKNAQCLSATKAVLVNVLVGILSILILIAIKLILLFILSLGIKTIAICLVVCASCYFIFFQNKNAIKSNIENKNDFKIVGQKQAMSKVNELIETRLCSDKVIATFFSGPSGTGKSTTAKYIAKKLNGEALFINCDRLNASDIFGTFLNFSISKKGMLDMCTKNTKVIVFDELDKNIKFDELLLQLNSALSDGCIITNHDNKIDLSKIVLIFISNQSDIWMNFKFIPIISRMHFFSDNTFSVEFIKERIKNINELEEIAEIDQLKSKYLIIKDLQMHSSLLDHYNNNIFQKNFDVRIFKNQIHNQVALFITKKISELDKKLNDYYSSDEFNENTRNLTINQIEKIKTNKTTEIYKDFSIKIICENKQIKCVDQDYIVKKQKKYELPFNITQDLEDMVGLKKQKEQIDYMLSRFKLNAIRSKVNELNDCATALYFVGPPGTGKTEMAHKIAKLLNGECAVVNCDNIDSNKFFGSSAGYVGYSATIPHNFNSNTKVILFDEIDKISVRYAQNDFLLSLTTMLSSNKIVFANNLEFDLSNVIIIFTANKDCLTPNSSYQPLISRLSVDQKGQYIVNFDNHIKLDLNNFKVILNIDELKKQYPDIIKNVSYDKNFEIWFNQNSNDLRKIKIQTIKAIENFIIQSIAENSGQKLSITLSTYENAVVVATNKNRIVI